MLLGVLGGIRIAGGFVLAFYAGKLYGRYVALWQVKQAQKRNAAAMMQELAQVEKVLKAFSSKQPSPAPKKDGLVN